MDRGGTSHQSYVACHQGSLGGGFGVPSGFVFFGFFFPIKTGKYSKA